MPRIPIASLLCLGLAGCALPEPPGPNRLAPSAVLTRAPGEQGHGQDAGCWTPDDALGEWIQTPCPAQLPDDFIAVLQRALAARGFFASAIDGELTPALRAAIRAYQTPLGLNSDVLSLGAAERLGLVPVAEARARAEAPQTEAAPEPIQSTLDAAVY